MNINLVQHKAEWNTWGREFWWMILNTIYYNNMVRYEDPTIKEWMWSYRVKSECEGTGKRENYGLSLKLMEIDKVSEMLEIPKWQDKNILQ